MISFLDKVSNWDNHRPLLFLALENTTGNVLELGMGDGSTPYLHEYCLLKNRQLESYDNNVEYCGKFNGLESTQHSIMLIKKWSNIKLGNYGVALIDHAPAEQRHIDAIKLKDKADIIIVHDAEHEGFDYDVYHIDKIAKEFKYRKDLVIQQHAAKTVMFSNKIDVSKLSIPNFNLF